MSGADTIFVAVNVNKKRNKLNPERSVCRFEMTEAIVRIAVKRFLKCACPGPVGAVCVWGRGRVRGIGVVAVPVSRHLTARLCLRRTWRDSLQRAR